MNPQTVIPKVYRFKMESLLNVKTQKVEAADYWLSQGKSIIQKLEISIKEKRKQYACPCCKTPVVLRYGKRRLPWFAHPVLENTQECRHVASKVKPKSSEEETLVPDSPQKVEQASDQKSTETRIIPFYSNDSTWDSTLGVSGVNYFVTSNDLSVVPTNDTRQTDEAVSQESVLPLPGAWEQVSFEFPAQALTPIEEETSDDWDDEDLNIKWILDRFNGKIPTHKEISDSDLVRLVFEQKLSRSLNNLRIRILDLKITGFDLPENILDVMTDNGLIKRMEETSQVQFERAS